MIQARSTAISLTPNTNVSSSIPAYIFNDGSIQSSNSNAVFISTGNGTSIENNGLISAYATAIQLSDGVGTSNIVNTGTLSATEGYGIYASGVAVDINNTGTIASSGAGGIYVVENVVGSLNTTYITNSGTISSLNDNLSIQILGDTMAEISNFGLITNSVQMSDAVDIVENGGTIGGDVNLGLGEDLYDGSGDSQVDGAVYGDAGNDDLFGGDNSDTLYGGTENDDLAGGLGNDFLYGDEGNDRIIADTDSANDFYNGGAGVDTVTYVGAALGIQANLGYEFAYSAEIGADRLVGFEVFVGGAGNDSITGAVNTTVIDGRGGNDTINGGTGNNILSGDSGDDTIRGFAGFDTINGGSGNDTLTGDFNADTFVFVDGFGNDTITDFDEFNNSERINLAGVTAIVNFTDLQLNHLTQVGANAVITDGTDSITLLNVNLADLDVNDFIF